MIQGVQSLSKSSHVKLFCTCVELSKSYLASSDVIDFFQRPISVHKFALYFGSARQILRRPDQIVVGAIGTFHHVQLAFGLVKIAFFLQIQMLLAGWLACRCPVVDNYFGPGHIFVHVAFEAFVSDSGQSFLSHFRLF
ncbi:hypothetical protein BpHYR1_039774 [Brachionus plicatilis]|uniref:Uncharacterized protein n=1 Tax=Brachionus plicatilis TaxID=10195 RepID=A0A3M7SLK8_BRAPC|nr:hypothetical protein BpHYR1_039774 [Brachionus plicatilis]